MGFCIYCKQDTNSETSCQKCYRSIMSTNQNMDEKKVNSAVFSTQRRSSFIDKWQDTYGKKAMFNNDISNKRMQSTYRNIPPFPNIEPIRQLNDSSTLKTCFNCNEKKEISWNNHSVYNSTFICKPCLSEKVTCPGCQTHFSESDTRICYSKQIYHTKCFKCSQCKSSLKPLLAVSDREGRPTCRACQLRKVSVADYLPSPNSTSSSTPLLSSYGSMKLSSDSFMTKYKKQNRLSMLDTKNTFFDKDDFCFEKQANIPLFDSPTYTTSQSSSLIPSKNIASVLPESSILLKKLPTERNYNVESAIESAKEKDSINRLKEVPLVTSKSRHPTKCLKKVAKRPCEKCRLHVPKKDYRGLRIQTGQVLCYHSNCLLCAKCNQHFDTLEFYTEGTNFYHTECIITDYPASPLSCISRQDSLTSVEDYMYPQTPPPNQMNFDNPNKLLLNTNNLISDDKIGQTVDLDIPIVTSVMCNACGNSISDSCLELQNNFYHKECLLCAECNETVPTERKLTALNGKLYCGRCTPINNKKVESNSNHLKVSTGPNKTISELSSKARSRVMSPSDIFKSRKNGLPRLGGARTCSGCNQSMSFLDTHPGPNASRWHKKCLRCSGCKKQMDSDAHMTLDNQSGVYQVHCRDCLDETPKPKFVR